MLQKYLGTLAGHVIAHLDTFSTCSQAPLDQQHLDVRSVSNISLARSYPPLSKYFQRATSSEVTMRPCVHNPLCDFLWFLTVVFVAPFSEVALDSKGHFRRIVIGTRHANILSAPVRQQYHPFVNYISRSSSQLFVYHLGLLPPSWP